VKNEVDAGAGGAALEAIEGEFVGAAGRINGAEGVDPADRGRCGGAGEDGVGRVIFVDVEVAGEDGGQAGGDEREPGGDEAARFLAGDDALVATVARELEERVRREAEERAVAKKTQEDAAARDAAEQEQRRKQRLRWRRKQGWW
jgi:hypothetical protein